MQSSCADVNSPYKRKCWTNSGGPLVNSLLQNPHTHRRGAATAHKERRKKHMDRTAPAPLAMMVKLACVRGSNSSFPRQLWTRTGMDEYCKVTSLFYRSKTHPFPPKPPSTLQQFAAWPPSSSLFLSFAYLGWPIRVQMRGYRGGGAFIQLKLNYSCRSFTQENRILNYSWIR
jgi:hypothetical protein